MRKPLTVVALAVLAFTSLGAFGRIWGAATAQVTILVATACVVMVDRPIHDLRSGVALFGVYLGVMAWGGLWLRDPKLRALIPFSQ